MNREISCNELGLGVWEEMRRLADPQWGTGSGARDRWKMFSLNGEETTLLAKKEVGEITSSLVSSQWRRDPRITISDSSAKFEYYTRMRGRNRVVCCIN